MRVFLLLLLCGLASAQTRLIPLSEVKPGMKGVGRTVFSGDRIEEFQVEILGVLENIGPKQSLILGRLSGGPLAETGVLQGMSGSPVYIDGRLAGAVAMAFAFSKQPVAGIRPIEEMLRVEQPAPSRGMRTRLMPWDGQLAKTLPPPEEVSAAGGRLVEIATPVSFGGFTRNTLEHFGPQLKALGLEPRQGIAGGGRLAPQLGDPSGIKPGSMISVQLLSGDLNIGADGTVTHVDGKRIYAFGHRFLSVGGTDLPFARSEVLTLLPNLSTSFKISSAREWMGAITQDRSTAVAGELGRRAVTVPVSITVGPRAGGPGSKTAYDLRMASDRVLAPFLLQMAVFSTIDATERAIGESSYAISGQFEFEDSPATLKVNNMYAGDFNLPAQVSLGVAAPVAYVLQSGFESLQLKRAALEIEALPRKRQLQIDQLWASRRELQPGDSLELTLVLSGDNGAEVVKNATYNVPIGAPPGPLFITAADANTANLTEFRQLLGSQPRSPEQVISFVNGLRPNSGAYVRLWRAQPAYDVQGETMHDPPPSLAMILAKSQGSLPGVPAMANSKVAEFELKAGDAVVTGSKTIQVEVKE